MENTSQPGSMGSQDSYNLVYEEPPMMPPAKKKSWRPIIIWVAIILVLLLVGYYFVWPSSSLNTANNGQSGQDQSSTTVTIANSQFSPANLTIHKGTTVIWTNNDDITHTVTADQDGPHSPELKKGSSYTDTFTTTGNFPYHCSLHPNMKGTITVIE